MDKTICGHDRETLRVALARAANADQDPSKAASALAWVMVAERTGYAGPDLLAFNDVHDPAKLAEMLAERGRQLGLGFWHGPNEPREPLPTDYVLYVIDGVIRLYSPLSLKAWQRQHTMAQARALLLKWLQLPDGAREEAEKVVRGES